MKQQAPLMNAYDAVKMQSAARATFVPLPCMMYNDPNLPISLLFVTPEKFAKTAERTLACENSGS